MQTSRGHLINPISSVPRRHGTKESNFLLTPRYWIYKTASYLKRHALYSVFALVSLLSVIGCIEEAKPPTGRASSFTFTSFELAAVNTQPGKQEEKKSKGWQQRAEKWKALLDENNPDDQAYAEKTDAFKNWALPDQAIYRYKVCLQDYRNNSPIQNHKFRVTDSTGFKTEPTTDITGCILWDKIYPVTYDSPTDYVEQVFQVSAEGIHKGKIKLRAFINPKATALGLPSERFLPLREGQPEPSFNYVPDKDILKSLNSEISLQPAKPQLVFNQLSFVFDNRIPGADKLVWQYELVAEPELQTLNEANTPVQSHLQSGELEVALTFLHKARSSDEFQVLSKEPFQFHTVEIAQQRLNKKLNTWLKGSLPQEGSLYVYFQARVQKKLFGAPDLEKFSGVFLIGEINNLPTGFARGILKQNIELSNSAEQTVLENKPMRDRPPELALDGPETIKGWDHKNTSEPEKLERRVDQYHFRILQMRYGGLDLSEETASSRTVKVLLTSCIQDPISFFPIRFRDFEVVINKNQDLPHAGPLRNRNTDVSLEKKLILTSDQDGCIRWADRVRHDYYKPEQFFVKAYAITDVHDGIRGASKTLKAVINPWNTGWLFARDFREVNPRDVAPSPPGGPRARLFMTQYSLSAKPTDYKIDDDLQLTLLRKYDLVLIPRVLRHDSQAYGFMGNESLRDGNYLLRLALVRDFAGQQMPPAAFVNSWQQVVRVNGGKIAVEIEFAIENLKLIGSRNKLIVDIKPIDESKVVYLPGQESMPLAEKLVDQEKTLSQPTLIRKDTGLVTNVFAGPIIPLYEGQGKSLIESPHLNFDEMETAGQAYIAKTKSNFKLKHQLTTYDQKNRLKAIDLDKASDLEWFSNTDAYQHDQVSNEALISRLLRSEVQRDDIDEELGMRLCHLWTESHLPEQLDTYASQDSDTARRHIPPSEFAEFQHFFLNWCLGEVVSGQSVFEYTKKLEIEKVLQDTLSYRGGQSFNLSVSSGFRMDKGQGWDVRNNYRSDLNFSYGGDLFGFLGVKRGESWSASEGESYTMGKGAGLSYGLGAYLVVQHSVFQLAVKVKNQCLIVKPKWEMMKFLMESRLVDIDSEILDRVKSGGLFGFGHRKREQDKLKKKIVKDLIPEGRLIDLMDTGLRVCQSDKSNHPKMIQEDYYYVTQHFTTGDMHDPTSLKNRPWLLQIRSQRDFNVFLRAILDHNNLSDVGKVDHSPIDILADAYSQYEGHLPSWPNLFTQYPANSLSPETCDPNSDIGEMMWEFAKQVVAGPLVQKDGYGIDFWQIYHCP